MVPNFFIQKILQLKFYQKLQEFDQNISMLNFKKKTYIPISSETAAWITFPKNIGAIVCEPVDPIKPIVPANNVHFSWEEKIYV